MPLHPEVLQARECAPTPSLFVVFIFGLIVESIKELRGASPRPITHSQAIAYKRKTLSTIFYFPFSLLVHVVKILEIDNLFFFCPNKNER
jgi:hypothetical protein